MQKNRMRYYDSSYISQCYNNDWYVRICILKVLLRNPNEKKIYCFINTCDPTDLNRENLMFFRLERFNWQNLIIHEFQIFYYIIFTLSYLLRRSNNRKIIFHISSSSIFQVTFLSLLIFSSCTCALLRNFNDIGWRPKKVLCIILLALIFDRDLMVPGKSTY